MCQIGNYDSRCCNYSLFLPSCNLHLSVWHDTNSIMNNQGPVILLFLFILMILCGVVLLFASFILPLTNNLDAKGLRAIGLSFLFFGAGELINHPPQKKRHASSLNKTNSETVYRRARNPCSLGNLFDVFGLISLFVALSFFFFPYDQ